MTNLRVSKVPCMVVVLCVATAIAARAQTFETIANFDGTDSAFPQFMSLVQGTDGNLYGTTVGGANTNSAGTVFKVSSRGALTTLYSFCTQPNCTDGQQPDGGLTRGTDGHYYGTTYYGGSTSCSSGCGTIFAITPQGELTTFYRFCAQTCTDGIHPSAGMVQGIGGDFYGTTWSGGASNGGTLFKISSGAALRTIYDFCSQPNCADGERSFAKMIQATDGKFYGTTWIGGTNDSGTVFKVTPDGKLTTLHSFDLTDGALPSALVQATDGSFYGVTNEGGDLGCEMPYGCGTLFRINRRGELTTLYVFESTDGAFPFGTLVQATDGNLYGTTIVGGDLTCNAPHGCGTVFQITPGAKLTTLHSFELLDGVYPYGGLVQDTNGAFYGTATNGGAHNGGTVFSLSMGLGPFVSFVRGAGRVGQTGPILGQGFTGTTSVMLNGIPASFTVVSDTYIRATVPAGATTGYVTVTTPSGTLTSNVAFHVIR